MNISCLASGNPLPSSDISWSLDGSSQSFSQTDITQNNTAYVPSAGTFSFSEGNVTSTLQITTAVYPTHDGVYNCSVSTDTGTALSDSITVEVVQGWSSPSVYQCSLCVASDHIIFIQLDMRTYVCTCVSVTLRNVAVTSRWNVAVSRLRA